MKYLCQVFCSFVLIVLTARAGVAAVSLCSEMRPCTTDAGATGICANGVCVDRIEPETRHGLTFVITAKYPVTTLQLHGARNLYVRGSGLGLSWSSGRQMVRQSQDTWSLDIRYASTAHGFRCEGCADNRYLEGKKLQFRIFADDNKDMLGGNFAINFPISNTSQFFHERPEYTVFPWVYTTSGVVQNATIVSRYIGGHRDIAVYYPPSFSENTYKTYPILTAFDFYKDESSVLKYLFDELTYPATVAEEAVMLLYGDYRIQTRRNLLTPTRSHYFECKEGNNKDNCNGCLPDFLNASYYVELMSTKCGRIQDEGGLGEQVLNFLIGEVVPEVQALAGGRLDTRRSGIMGYSLGGLMACHAAWTRPHVYSFAACMSSPFWWPFNNETFKTCEFDFLNKTLKDPTLASNRPPQRIYIDVGGAENDAPYSMVDAALEAARTMTSYDHYDINVNVWVEVSPNRKHNLLEGIRRISNAIATLLPLPGEPAMPTILQPGGPEIIG